MHLYTQIYVMTYNGLFQITWGTAIQQDIDFPELSEGVVLTVQHSILQVPGLRDSHYDTDCHSLPN